MEIFIPLQKIIATLYQPGLLKAPFFIGIFLAFDILFQRSQRVICSKKYQSYLLGNLA
tara:strand:+ start:335 stop:508 length:174 start_codon:yes stop_codon:yes gene_type:complete